MACLPAPAADVKWVEVHTLHSPVQRYDGLLWSPWCAECETRWPCKPRMALGW